MPMRALKPCRYPGCPRTTATRYCDKHASCEYKHVKTRKQVNPELMRADEFYLSPEWRALRKLQLELEPFCRTCSANNRVTAAQMADHIKPINQGGAKLDLNNLQSLCHPCHNRKRQQEARGPRPDPKRRTSGSFGL